MSLFAIPAWAQQRDPIQQLGADWGSLNVSIVHAADDLKAVIAENTRLQKRLTDLDAYLKACGDRPGCTVPISELKK